MTDIKSLDISFGMQLAVLDQKLMQEEGSDCDKNLVQLEMQMKSWLSHDFQASGIVTEGLLVAFVLYRTEEHRLLIKKIYVDDDYRRSGLATELMANVQAVDEAKPIELHVAPRNDSALLFYQSLGFVEMFRTLRGQVVS